MFSKETIDLYHSIRAPQSVMDAIDRKMDQPAATSSKRKNILSPVLAAAACLAVILWAGVLSPESDMLIVNGNKISNAAVAVYDENASRSAVAFASNNAFSLTLSLPKNSQALSVSIGELLESEDSVKSGRNFTWLIPSATEETTATLTFSIDEKVLSYTLHADTNGVWYMEKTSN